MIPSIICCLRSESQNASEYWCIIHIESLPVFMSSAKTLLVSIMVAVPLTASVPPFIHASLWFPIITYRSGMKGEVVQTLLGYNYVS